jgi:prevent-host-death family protein
VKEVPLSEIKDDLSRYLREAETQEIVITRHGKPVGVLIGFGGRLVRISAGKQSAIFAQDRAGAKQFACRTRAPAGGRRNGLAA